MNLKKAVILSGMVIVTMAVSQIVFAEEAQVLPTEPAAATATVGSESLGQKDSDMQWAWGEVTNLDNQAQTLTLKYLDYETDQEKEMVLVVNDKTTFENIKDFSELKLKDTLSIDYVIGADNKNIAKNINFEKPDALSAASAETAENSQPAVAPAAGVEQPAAEQPVVAAQPAAAAETAATTNLAQPEVKPETPANPPVPAKEEKSDAAAPAEAAPAATEPAPAGQGQAQ